MEERFSFPRVNILRVLVTNICNHDCVFCHNEGQIRNSGLFLDPESFRTILSPLYKLGTRNIQFSGGEPFLHKKFIDIIEIARRYSPYFNLGVATNGVLINEQFAREIAPHMSNIRINLPVLNSTRYAELHGVDDLNRTLKTIEWLTFYKAKVGINTVYYDQSFQEILDLIRFCGEVNLDLKILEWVNMSNRGESPSIFELCKKLENIDNNSQFISPSVRKFTIQTNQKKVSVRIIFSLCKLRNSAACQDYGEVRLLPDFRLQSCLIPGHGIVEIKDNSEISIMDALRKSMQAIGCCP